MIWLDLPLEQLCAQLGKASFWYRGRRSSSPTLYKNQLGSCIGLLTQASDNFLLDWYGTEYGICQLEIRYTYNKNRNNVWCRRADSRQQNLVRMKRFSWPLIVVCCCFSMSSPAWRRGSIVLGWSEANIIISYTQRASSILAILRLNLGVCSFRFSWTRNVLVDVG